MQFITVIKTLIGNYIIKYKILENVINFLYACMYYLIHWKLCKY